MWLGTEIGLAEMIRVARELGIRSPLHPFPSTVLGASEVRLLELAGAYRAMASGIRAEPYVIHRVTAPSGAVLYSAPLPAGNISSQGLSQIQEGLRGAVRIPGGTASALGRRDFPIPVMGKTGTTNDFRDGLFVGSTYGPDGVTVAVRIGFDDNRSMGAHETGGRTALPIFREIMLRVYGEDLVGPAPEFPREIERGINGYLAAAQAAAQSGISEPTGRQRF
jgi:penicillin-binding protein 1A